MSTYHQEIASVTQKVRTFFGKTFTDISINGPELDLEKLHSTPLMLVSTHRSHVDYFLSGNVFHSMGLKNLRFAAGDNLTNLPWIGAKFKAFGAFAISRDTGFDRNYVKNLCNSVVAMIERGDTVLVFPEGGRSYSGSMLEMRIGVLGASVLSQANTPERDINYIPIAMSYEHAPDIRWYGMQQKGKKWRKKSNPFPVRFIGNILYFGADIFSFIPFVFAPRLRKKYGKVFIDYGKPFAIRSIVDVVANKSENARDDFSAHKNSMVVVSNHAREQLQKLYRILPIHLVANLLKEHGKQSIEELTRAIPAMIQQQKALERNTAQFEGCEPEAIVHEGVEQLRRCGALTLKKTVCSVKKTTILHYYAAAIS